MHPAVAAYEAAYAVADPVVASELVSRAFAPEGALVSPWLAQPVVGHQALTKHVVGMQARLAGMVALHTSAVDRVANVLRWTWAFEADGQVVSEGLDVAVLAPDERISLLVVFDGPTPPQAA